MNILIVCTTDSMIWNFLVPHIEELESEGHRVECACSETGFYYSELEKKPIAMHKMQFTRNPFSISNVKALGKLRKLISSREFDAVYCHEPVGGLMGRLAGKSSHVNVVYMSHGFHFFNGAPIKHWLLYYPAEFIMSFMTDACITINHEDYDRACRMFSKRKYYVHGIGIQPGKDQVTVDRITMREQLDLEKDDFVIISIGELSKRKNHRIILQTMHLLQNKRIKLILCGDGEQENKLHSLANEYGLTGAVLFAGFVKNIADFLNASDVMVFPSLWEGLGLAGLEALQMGVPVIGSCRQGIKDYVHDGLTGYLFDPCDHISLASKLRLVMQHNCLKDNQESMKQVTREYSLETVLEEFRPIYLREFTPGAPIGIRER